MNEQQSKMMNQSMMNQVAMMSQQQQHQQQSQLMAAQSQAMNINHQQKQLMAAQSQGMNLINSNSQSMPPPPQMMGGGGRGGYKPWPQQQKQLSGGFVPKQGRSNWKGRKGGGGGGDMRKDGRRMDKSLPLVGNIGPGPSGGLGVGIGIGGGGYKPPSLNELQSQNRAKAKKFYHQKKRFNNRFAPYAPRNTSSFIIRAKKSGGIASLVSPCPVTPAVLPTPVFSPSREVLGDMAKEEWGVDGYGSMKGLIRLRNDAGDGHDEDDDEEGGGGSSDSDVEEHVEVERRLDHDLSRFEMIYPNYGLDYNNVLENRVDDQDTHIAQLEEENLTLKERLFLMESEVAELRRRMQSLERQNHLVEDVNEEVVENVSENESEGGVSDTHGRGKEDTKEFVCGNQEGKDHNVNAKDEGQDDMMLDNEGKRDVSMEVVKYELNVKETEVKDEGATDKDDLGGAGDGNEKYSSCEFAVGQVTEKKAHSEDEDVVNKIEMQNLTSEIDGAKSGASPDKDEGKIAMTHGHKNEDMVNTSS